MKVPMIIAIVLICIGLLLSFFALLAVRFDVRLFSSVPYEQKEMAITDSFSDILLELDTHDVKLVPVDEGGVRVVYDEPKSEKMWIEMAVADGKLSIAQKDTRKWYEKINLFGFGRHGITVYLPAGVYGALDIRLSTGRITVEKDFTFTSASIVRSTGDLYFKATVTGEVNIEGDTGDNSLSGSYGSLKLKSTTGDTQISDLTVLGNLEISQTTGDIDMRRVVANEVILKVSTGDIEVNDLKASGNMSVYSTTGEIELSHTVIDEHLKIASDTGDVELDASDAATLNITTDTGDVSGRLLTDKQFFAESDTGRVRVPKTTGGRCEITTDTGNIDFLGDD